MLWKNLRKQLPLVYKTLLLWVLTFSSLLLSGQTPVSKYVVSRPKKAQDAFRFQASETFTAIAIQKKGAVSESIVLNVKGEKIVAWLDEHSPIPTYFVSLPISTNVLEITVEGQITVFTINSGQTPSLNTAAKPNNENCPGSFEAVPQSEWRSGLASPNFSRVTHEVTHHIVHHSAGSNSNTNYTQVVRDIYLFHTQVNGWSDIGYNFVVAQDGTIYEGRDPGPSISEFEVMGAHFCGKNTGTMGIAMLGNFETTDPSEEAITSLESILAFSMDNLAIDPLSTATHSGQSLETVAGHRDGCATLCPGKNLYSRLPELREQVVAKIEDCESLPDEPSIYPNPVAAGGQLNINFGGELVTNTIISLSGKEMASYSDAEGILELPPLQRGVYLLRTVTTSDSFVTKFAVN